MLNKSRMTFTLMVVSLGVAFFSSDTRAQNQTATAKGSVTVNAESCQFTPPTGSICSIGGSGAKVSFSFTGDVIDPNAPSFAAQGSFSMVYPDTGFKTVFVGGTAVIFTSTHRFFFEGESVDRS